MSRYMQDPDNPNKQIPAPLPDNAYGRTTTPAIATAQKSPNSILVLTQLTRPINFSFQSSASFAASPSYTMEMSGSEGHITAGTALHIHPTDWSGSSADAGKIAFVYNGGLSTGGQ